MNSIFFSDSSLVWGLRLRLVNRWLGLAHQKWPRDELSKVPSDDGDADRNRPTANTYSLSASPTTGSQPSWSIGPRSTKHRLHVIISSSSSCRAFIPSKAQMVMCTMDNVDHICRVSNLKQSLTRSLRLSSLELRAQTLAGGLGQQTTTWFRFGSPGNGYLVVFYVCLVMLILVSCLNSLALGFHVPRPCSWHLASSIFNFANTSEKLLGHSSADNLWRNK